MEKIYQGYSAEDWRRAGEEDEQEVLTACRSEIDRLADFILEKMPEEIGKGNPQQGESAVDVAIRLLSERA